METTDRLARNKANVAACYDPMFNQCRPAEAIDRYRPEKVTGQIVQVVKLLHGRG